MSFEDPLWKMRHALAGVGIAILLSIFSAALVGAALADAFGGSYGARVTCYAVLLVYAVVGAVVLFIKVAQHETTPLSFARVARWFASLWLWPLLLIAAKKA